MSNPGEEIVTTQEDLLQIIGKEVVLKENATKKYFAALDAFIKIQAELEALKKSVETK